MVTRINSSAGAEGDAMIRILILFSTLFFVSEAFAQSTEVAAPAPEAVVEEVPAAKVDVKLGLGYQARLEKSPGSTEQTQTLESPSIFAQVDYLEYEIHTELERVQHDTGEGSYRIQSSRLELLFIGRYRLMLDPQWTVFGGLGGGFGKETVRTSVGGSKATHTGDTEKIGALEAGLQYQFDERFFAEASARGLKLENFEPWVVTMGLRLGVRL